MYVTYEQIVSALKRDGIHPTKKGNGNNFQGIPVGYVRAQVTNLFPNDLAEQIQLIGNLLEVLHTQQEEDNHLLKKKCDWVQRHLQDWVDEGIRQSQLDARKYELIHGTLWYKDPDKQKQHREKTEEFTSYMSEVRSDAKRMERETKESLYNESPY